MIEKMSFVTLAGPKSEIDGIIDTYLSKHDIHLEDAVTELGPSKEFVSFSEENPYKEILATSQDIMALVKNPGKSSIKKMDLAKAENVVNKTEKDIEAIRAKINNLETHKTALQQDYDILAPFKTLNYPLKKIREMTFLRYRFGKLPKTEYDKFESYLDPDLNEIFYNCLLQNDYVYGVIFAPKQYFEEIERDLKTIHFDSIGIPEEFEGFPDDECLALAKEIAVIDEQIKDLWTKIHTIIENHKDSVVAACRRIEMAYGNFDVKKYAATTKKAGIAFQVLCGWMTSREAKVLQRETEDDVNVVFMINDNVNDHKTKPPTKLKNAKLIKPFEMFVRMYGLPSYNEFDPTLLVTLTYALMFGAMFGDLGQGLVLFFGGMILYRLKKLDLAGIVCAAGFSSSIFGILFGSVFGFEFESFIKPLDSMMTLPFIGDINTVLVVAFLFGSFVILMTMVLNIIISIKQRNVGRALFGPNAVTGFIFYAGVISVIVLYMTGHALPGTIALIILFVIPLLLIFLEEPLKNLINKNKPVINDSPGMFAATAFFELFDYLITYLSNALSFLRIGVFAISHAAMMQVVMTLAGAENGGSANIIVVIIGNIIVLGMEGLVVGIQVLRLEYYEIFGRFYEGSGREFIPYTKNFKH